jgi:hypothetical protein
MSLKSLIAAADFAKVEAHLASFPDEAGELGRFNLFSEKSKSYPLHYLCRRKDVPLSTMRAMLKVTPWKALVYPDSVAKSTPLHLACWYKLPSDAIMLLLEENKQSLTMKDIEGNLPVHLAAALHPEAARLVAAFLALRPDTALSLNDKSQTPLHSLCTRDEIPVHVLESLLAAGPTAASRKDRMGRLPLHHACLHQASYPVLERLLEAHPKGVKEFDHGALTPYGIVRRRWHWNASDARLQLLRKDMLQTSRRCLPVVVKNHIQFTLEDWSGSSSQQHTKGHPRVRPVASQ